MRRVGCTAELFAMSLDFDSAYQMVANQPLSTLLGARVTAYTTEMVEIQLPISPDLANQHGFVHGGGLAFMADNTLTLAGSLALGAEIVTSEFKINFLRPAMGGTLIARARVLHGGKRQAVCQCDIYCSKDGQEKLCAVAQGTISRIGSPTQG